MSSTMVMSRRKKEGGKKGRKTIANKSKQVFKWHSHPNLEEHWLKLTQSQHSGRMPSVNYSHQKTFKNLKCLTLEHGFLLRWASCWLGFPSTFEEQIN